MSVGIGLKSMTFEAKMLWQFFGIYVLSSIPTLQVVLSGEGADEIFGGYLYFHNAPNNDEFQKVGEEWRYARRSPSPKSHCSQHLLW